MCAIEYMLCVILVCSAEGAEGINRKLWNHVVNRPEEDPSSGKLESTHPSRTSVKYDQVFFWCRSQSCVSTLPH